MSTRFSLLHQSSRRLRVRYAAGPAIDFDSLATRLEGLGVDAVRVDALRRTVLVRDDGSLASRSAVLDVLTAPPMLARRRRHQAAAPSTTALSAGLALAMMPLLPPAGRAALTLATLGLRVLRHPPRSGEDWRVLLARAAQTIGGHPLAALGGLGLQALAERFGQAQEAEAARLLLELEPDGDSPCEVRTSGTWRPTRADALAPDDRIRLQPGMRVPTDLELRSGDLRVLPPWHASGSRPISEPAPGSLIVAGSTILAGNGEASVRSTWAESSASHVRDQIAHLLRARRLPRSAPGEGPLPLAVSAIVLGFTGDLARAGALLETDLDAGLALAAPLARDSAAWALARHGAVLADLDGLERLARADTLVIEDLGLVVEGEWRLAASTLPGGRRRAQALLAVLLEPGAPRRWHDRLVESLCQRGAMVESAGEWTLRADPLVSTPGRRVFQVTRDGQPAGEIVLELAARPGLASFLARARAAGFHRIVRIAHPEAPRAIGGFDGCIRHRRSEVREALEDLAEGGNTLAVYGPSWRAQVPPGAVTLAPVDAEAPAHFLLLGDPAESLLAARALSMAIQRRERQRQDLVGVLNAALMSAAALRWLPPEASAVLHQAIALGCMIDALALRKLGVPHLPGDYP
jgi:hypothetical protein